jgi:hypothetical protein
VERLVPKRDGIGGILPARICFSTVCWQVAGGPGSWKKGSFEKSDMVFSRTLSEPGSMGAVREGVGTPF